MPQPVASRRLFFALYPDASARAALHALATREISATSGRLVVADNMHATLIFLGHLAPPRVGCVRRMGAAIDGDAVSLVIDRLGHWRGPEVIWAGCSRVPTAVQYLVDRLRNGVTACGIDIDPRPFEVHFTLARGAARPFAARELQEPLSLYFDRFCLMASLPVPGGVRYEVEASWPLRRAGPA